MDFFAAGLAVDAVFTALTGAGFVLVERNFWNLFECAAMGLRYHPASWPQKLHPIEGISRAKGEPRV
jgi:hypothetical protein